MDKSDLDKQRETVIEEIKLAFPVSASFDGVLTTPDARIVASDRLTKMLSGKNWLEAARHRSVVYNLSEIDHLEAITDDAYAYYLPSLLLRMMETEESSILFLTLDRILKIAPMLSLNQLQVLIMCIQYEKDNRQFFDKVFEPEFTNNSDEYDLRLDNALEFLDGLVT